MDRAMGEEMSKMIDTMQEFMDKVKVREDVVEESKAIKNSKLKNNFAKDKQSLTT